MGSGKEKVFKVETFSPTFALSCIASWSSLHRCWNPRRGMTSSDRCSLVNVSSEFGGGQSWYNGGMVASGFESSVFLYKDVNTEM